MNPALARCQGHGAPLRALDGRGRVPKPLASLRGAGADGSFRRGRSVVCPQDAPTRPQGKESKVDSDSYGSTRRSGTSQRTPKFAFLFGMLRIVVASGGARQIDKTFSTCRSPRCRGIGPGDCSYMAPLPCTGAGPTTSPQPSRRSSRRSTVAAPSQEPTPITA